MFPVHGRTHLDGLNRYRFAAVPDLLAAWIAACNVVAAPRTAEPAIKRGIVR